MTPRVRRVSRVDVMLLGFVVGLTPTRRTHAHSSVSRALVGLSPEGVTVISSVAPSPKTETLPRLAVHQNA